MNAVPGVMELVFQSADVSGFWLTEFVFLLSLFVLLVVLFLSIRFCNSPVSHDLYRRSRCWFSFATGATPSKAIIIFSLG